MPAKEKQRLKRINDEFARAFKALDPIGPAVKASLKPV